jgi:hypothetical protein
MRTVISLRTASGVLGDSVAENVPASSPHHGTPCKTFRTMDQWGDSGTVCLLTIQ